ncbi:MAG: LamG domain-containing protein, partial [Candidatus Gracilibacteria bacterium]
DNLGFLSLFCQNGKNLQGAENIDCGQYDYGVKVGAPYTENNLKKRRLTGFGWNPVFGYIQFSGQVGSTSGQGSSSSGTSPAITAVPLSQPIVITPPPQDSATASQIAYYQFENSLAKDSTAFGHDGTISGQKIFSSGVAGSAIKFTDKNDYITVPHKDDLNRGTGSFTVSFWMKASPSGTGLPYANIIYKNNGTSSTGNNWYVRQYVDTGRIQMLISDTKNYMYLVSSVDKNLFDNSWHNVVYILGEDASQKFYIDGVLNSQYAGTVFANAKTINQNGVGTLRIGGQIVEKASTTYGTFLGMLDEVSIYNYAWTEGMITKSYDNLKTNTAAIFSTKPYIVPLSAASTSTTTSSTTPSGLPTDVTLYSLDKKVALSIDQGTVLKTATGKVYTGALYNPKPTTFSGTIPDGKVIVGDFYELKSDVLVTVSPQALLKFVYNTVSGNENPAVYYFSPVTNDFFKLPTTIVRDPAGFNFIQANISQFGKYVVLKDVPSLPKIAASYRMENNGNDSFGINNGKVTSTVIYADGVTKTILGDFEKSMSFATAKDYVTVSHNAELNAGIGPFSVSFWMKARKTVNGNGGYVPLIYKNNGSGGSSNNWYIRQYSSTNKLEFQISDYYKSANLYTSVSKDFFDNKWHNVVYVVEKDRSQKVYIDGVLDAESSLAMTNNAKVIDQTGTGVLKIGGSLGYDPYNGRLDEIFIYNYPLDFADIQKNYDALKDNVAEKIASENQTVSNGLIQSDLTIMSDDKRFAFAFESGTYLKKADNTFYSGNINKPVIFSDAFVVPDGKVLLGNIYKTSADSANLTFTQNATAKFLLDSSLNTNLQIYALKEGDVDWTVIPSNVSSDALSRTFLEAKVGFFGQFAVVADQVKENAKISQWNMDELDMLLNNGVVASAKDIIGFNDLIVTNGAKAAKGIFGNALYFDGVDDSADVAHKNEFNFGKGPFSVSLWVKAKEPNNIYGQTNLIYKNSGFSGAYNNWVVKQNGLAKTLVFGYSDGYEWSPLYGVTNVFDDKWHHVVAVIDPQVSQKLYVDGKLDAKKDLSTRTVVIDQSGKFNLRIGGSIRPDYSFFKGKIDEVELYNYVISDADILSAYKNLSGNFVVNKTAGSAASDANGYLNGEAQISPEENNSDFVVIADDGNFAVSGGGVYKGNLFVSPDNIVSNLVLPKENFYLEKFTKFPLMTGMRLIIFLLL